MLFITQLIYVKEGKEEMFLAFEAHAIPLMEKYGGEIIYRIRPTKTHFIDPNTEEQPYEIHLISFKSEADFEEFMQDKDRLKFVHLKNESVKSILLIKGKRI